MNFADLRFWECLLAALLVAAGFRSAFRGAAAVRDGRFDRWFLLILGLVLLGLVSSDLGSLSHLRRQKKLPTI